MRFEVIHEIEYRYSSPVFLEPQTFYLRPREDASQRLLRFDLTLDPEPAIYSEQTDPSGNAMARAWYRGTWERFRIEARSEVEIIRPNPFDYLPDEGCVRLPVQYRPETARWLNPSLCGPPVDASVTAFAAGIAARVQNETLSFLFEFCREISVVIKRIHRATGAAWPAAETLVRREGSCRDTAVLFMECCRSLGLAARFTSGYFEGDHEDPENELHAWCEVYLEGGGWRGFDPINGLAVGEAYLSLASAPDGELLAPVSGSFRGSASAALKTRVQFRRK